ncbi:mitochondrial import inner membrane translocase subunit TIM9 [Uncinocarpus reesii 1704]|uniref:Mitochondrial import inner membrane translocase subunit TIM9 n=1 Tax=Uncinocarpus reesii (strain UAMH 1704) TaxID=336963 RepID=C4JD89_UNCRE|nr:mitochondrial import inner membrane translocase subunit TIM9 [Uncinocarpus reesii 1704]EEP75450.1 mitochondrial import inner membrane translocase subunit TIM9 [Uncinocarpus reesii 1704]
MKLTWRECAKEQESQRPSPGQSTAAVLLDGLPVWRAVNHVNYSRNIIDPKQKRENWKLLQQAEEEKEEEKNKSSAPPITHKFTGKGLLEQIAAMDGLTAAEQQELQNRMEKKQIKEFMGVMPSTTL